MSSPETQDDPRLVLARERDPFPALEPVEDDTGAALTLWGTLLLAALAAVGAAVAAAVIYAIRLAAGPL
jgi:hypothetical protein